MKTHLVTLALKFLKGEGVLSFSKDRRGRAAGELTAAGRQESNTY
jgi:hypothetical protein